MSYSAKDMQEQHMGKVTQGSCSLLMKVRMLCWVSPMPGLADLFPCPPVSSEARQNPTSGGVWERGHLWLMVQSLLGLFSARTASTGSSWCWRTRGVLVWLLSGHRAVAIVVVCCPVRILAIRQA